MRLLCFFLSSLVFFLASCSREPENLAIPSYDSFLATTDGRPLAIQHWNLQPQPKKVLIALHGLQGAAKDFRNLGKSLKKQAPDTTLYALNLRGAGYDPVLTNRGDIRSLELWKRDLLELHQTMRQRHPDARIFWIGESMGSQIVLHTAAESLAKPEGLILTSPVVSLNSIPGWQVNSLRVAAFLAPKKRLSLEALAGGTVEDTANADHFEQSEKNAYNVENYTLRYLKALETLTVGMNEKAAQTDEPTLILYGGKDFLIEDSDISKFSRAFPRRPQVALFESSDHLLFYGKERQKVISEILTWISRPQ